MPLPNFHSARINEPDKYKKIRYEKNKFGAGIDAVWGVLPDNTVELQAIRFDAEKFTADEAKKWLKEHDYKFSFEEAKEVKEAVTQSQILQYASIQPEIPSDSTPRGSKWLVTIIKVGQSLAPSPQDFYFSSDLLRQSTHLFEGVSVFAHKAGSHVDPGTKSTTDSVGWIDGVYFDEMEQALKGTLNVLPSAEWLKQNLLFAFENKKIDLYELSIDAGGVTSLEVVNGVQRKSVKQFSGVGSVDIVDRGAAGGKFDRLIQSLNNQKGQNPMKDKLLALIKQFFPSLLADKKVDVEKATDDELVGHLTQALTSLADEAKAKLEQALKPIQDELAKTKQPSNEVKELQEAMKQMKMLMAQQYAVSAISDSKLPEPIQQALKSQFSNRIVTETEVNDAIKVHRDAYAKVVSTIPQTRVAIGLEQKEKIQLGLDGFFLEKAIRPLKADERKEMLKGIDPMRSIKQAYVALTGDELVSGFVDHQRISQSIDTTDWAYVLANSLNRRLVRDYIDIQLDTWKAFTDIVPLSDFREQARVRYGGYANLPVVPSGAAYTGLTSPTDENATYSPAKRGGTEDITREVIKNDDVGSVQKIPTRMARAAAQTLHEFVYEFLNPATNAAIYDAVALYHSASHANYATTALASDALAAARLRMKKQTMKDNSKRLGLRAGFLLVPPDLEKTAYELTQKAYGVYNEVPAFLQNVGIIPIVVDYWTDATDWALVAKKEDITGLEVGFVDGNELPEIFVSDLPNVGSFFTNDKVTFKIRHEYGGAVIDYRAFDGSVVA